MITYDIRDGVVSMKPNVLFSGELPQRPTLTPSLLAQMDLTTQVSLSAGAIFNTKTTCIYSQNFVKI